MPDLEKKKKASMYDYSSVQINLLEDLSKKIITWGKENIPDKELYDPEDDPKYGRENKPHVTILYGLHTNKFDDVKKYLDDKSPVTLKLGKTGFFEPEDEPYDVIYVEVLSDDMQKLNKILRDNLEYTNDFPEYHPHTTIAYVKKGNGKKYKNKTVVPDLTTVDSYIFSPAEGKQKTGTFKKKNTMSRSMSMVVPEEEKKQAQTYPHWEQPHKLDLAGPHVFPHHDYIEDTFNFPKNRGMRDQYLDQLYKYKPLPALPTASPAYFMGMPMNTIRMGEFSFSDNKLNGAVHWDPGDFPEHASEVQIIETLAKYLQGVFPKLRKLTLEDFTELNIPDRYTRVSIENAFTVPVQAAVVEEEISVVVGLVKPKYAQGAVKIGDKNYQWVAIAERKRGTVVWKLDMREVKKGVESEFKESPEEANRLIEALREEIQTSIEVETGKQEWKEEFGEEEEIEEEELPTTLPSKTTELDDVLDSIPRDKFMKVKDLLYYSLTHEEMGAYLQRANLPKDYFKTNPMGKTDKYWWVSGEKLHLYTDPSKQATAYQDLEFLEETWENRDRSSEYDIKVFALGDLVEKQCHKLDEWYITFSFSPMFGEEYTKEQFRNKLSELTEEGLTEMKSTTGKTPSADSYSQLMKAIVNKYKQMRSKQSPETAMRRV